MTIENPKAYCNNLWDWACLDGCFENTSIAPTDIDGFVERNGQFMVIETKAPGKDIPRGQDITFTNLVTTGYFTVIIAWGRPGEPEAIELRYQKQDDVEVVEYPKANLNTLRSLVSWWFREANKK